MPTAMASEKSTASIKGRPRATLPGQDRDAEDAADLGQQDGEPPESHAGSPCGAAAHPTRRQSPRTGWTDRLKRRPPRPTRCAQRSPMNAHEGQLRKRRAGDRRFDRLDRWFGFAGQDRLVALQLDRRQQPHVRRNDRPHLQMDHVAGNQVGHFDADGNTIANSGHHVPDTGMQRLRSSLSAELVDKSQSHRRCQDHRNDHRIEALADERRDRSGCKQQPQQRTVELPAKHRQRARVVGTDRIRAKHRDTSIHLGAVEPPATRVNGQKHFVCRHRRGGIDRGAPSYPQKSSSHAVSPENVTS
jgi:hypothetical protein